MSILGAVVRTRPHWLGALRAQLQGLTGVDIAVDPGDGRLVIVIDDAAWDEPEQSPAVSDRAVSGPGSGSDPGSGANAGPGSAAETLSSIGRLPGVLSLSLVYEYSGPDAPPLCAVRETDFRAWRNPSPARRSSPCRGSPDLPGALK